MKREGVTQNLHEKIRLCAISRSIIFSNHAGERMFERDISPEDVMELLLNGEIIEEGSERRPCPEALLFGYDSGKQPCHVAIAVCKDHIKIVTVYRPAEDKWIDGRVRIRK